MKVLVGVVVILLIAGGIYWMGNNKAKEQATTTPNETELLLSGVKDGLIAKHGSESASLNLTISKIEGSFAKGMANGTGGGGIWLATKAGGAWKLVWDGNGIITCNDLGDYPNFPNTFIPQCYDEKTSKMVTR